MVRWNSKKLGDLLLLANGLVALVLVNVVSAGFFFRADLTAEKRYSIKAPTRALLRDLEENVYVEVFLAGELNAGFQRFQKAIRETLDEFRVYSGNKVQVRFTDPAAAISQKAQSEFMSELAAKGVQPTRVIDKKDGQRIEKLIFPGALVSYGNRELGVQLLKGNKARSPEEEINQSIEGIEFEIANAIYKLANDNPKRVGIVRGHGEIDSLEAAGFKAALFDLYDVEELSLLSEDLYSCDALVIAKPVRGFSEKEQYKLDQYIMQRGNVLFLLDKLDADMDSAVAEGYLAVPMQLNLDDMLFRYGVRINMDLLQDRTSGMYPVVTGQSGSKPQVQLMDWPFFPLINRYADHLITHNLDAVVLRFASSIDTVRAAGVRKTPLMFTSAQSRAVSAPVDVSVGSLMKDVSSEQYTRQHIPVAYLLEGTFTSVFKNRFLPEGERQAVFTAESRPGAKLIVVADGDLAANVVNPRTRQPQPLGFDPFTNYTFANQDLLLNMLAYLTDENGLIRARNKEVRIRLLSEEKVASERALWQVLNLVVPLLILAAYGLLRAFLRKRRYARF